VVSEHSEERAAVFLDRDGVLDEPIVIDGRPYPPPSLAELVVVPTAPAACQALHDAGLLLIVVTNQPDIRRGTQSVTTVEAIHDQLRSQLPIDDILMCPHDEADRCDCRKPADGLLRRAASSWTIDLRRSVMVGDRWRDIEAGRSAGCATVLVDRQYDEPRATADLVVGSLLESVPWIVDRHRSMEEGRRAISI
jgi:D-glycero-D-manno-heptose 1,7-bisphosphate phosphatase